MCVRGPAPMDPDELFDIECSTYVIAPSVVYTPSSVHHGRSTRDRAVIFISVHDTATMATS